MRLEWVKCVCALLFQIAKKVLISAAHPPNKTSPGAFAPELVLCTSIRIDAYWGLVVLCVPDVCQLSWLPITVDSHCSHVGAPKHHLYDFIIGRSCVIFMNDLKKWRSCVPQLHRRRSSHGSHYRKCHKKSEKLQKMAFFCNFRPLKNQFKIAEHTSHPLRSTYHARRLSSLIRDSPCKSSGVIS